MRATTQFSDRTERHPAQEFLVAVGMLSLLFGLLVGVAHPGVLTGFLAGSLAVTGVRRCARTVRKTGWLCVSGKRCGSPQAA